MRVKYTNAKKSGEKNETECSKEQSETVWNVMML
jgi:hypothetical protein